MTSASRTIMTVTPQKFRRLMIASLILALLGGAVDIAFPGLVPERVREADAAFFDTLPTERLLALGVVALAATIGAVAAFVGLFRFRSWARPLNLVLCASVLLLWPLLCHFVSSGVALALSDLSALAWGAVTALSYVPPLDERFEPPYTPRHNGN